MFAGLLGTFLIAVATVINKRGITHNAKKLSNMAYEWFGEAILLLFLVILFFVSPFVEFLSFDFRSFSLLFVGLIFLRKALVLTAVNLFYDVFQKEKMSHILPLNSFDRIFTTVLGFFLFHTTSGITVLFALLAAAILIVSQIDFKTFRLSGYVVLFVIIGALKSSSQLITGYLLAYLTSFELFLSGVTAAFLLMLVYTSIRGELRGIWKSVSRPVVACRTIDKVFVVASTLITYSVIKEFGLVTMLLISFFGYISKLILAFVLLKEVPSLKETLVGLSILLCIFLGTYYG